MFAGRSESGSGWSSRAVALVAVALICLGFSTPAQAQYNYGSGYGTYNQGYYNQGYTNQGYNQGYSGGYQNYYQQKPSWFDSWFGSRNTGSEGLGRTLGGAAGLAAGSFGGAAIASAVIKSAGIAAMGPIAPILIGTAITAGAGFVGSKLGSQGGSWMDRAMGPDMTWTLVGATAGAVAGFALLPALGPFAGPAGRVVGAALGGLAGGLLGKIFAPTAQRFATPKTIYGATGAVIGAAGFGIPGAIAGAVGGYVLGSIFDKNFFATPGYTAGQDIRANIVDYRQPLYQGQAAANSIRNWFSNTTNYVGNRLNSNNNGYYSAWAPNSTYGYIGAGNPYVSGGGYSYGSGYYPASPSTTGAPAAPTGLAELKRAYQEAETNFRAVSAQGGDTRTAYDAMIRSKASYEAAERQGVQ